MHTVAGKVLIEPYFNSKALAAEVKKRSGLEVAKIRDNKTSFEGVPNQGFIYALPADYHGELRLGQLVIFRNSNPKGFMWEGKTLFPLELDQILGIVKEDES